MLAWIQKTKALPVVLIWKHFFFNGAVQKSWIWALFLPKKHLIPRPSPFHLRQEPSVLSLALYSFLLSFIWVTDGFSQIYAELKDCI